MPDFRIWCHVCRQPRTYRGGVCEVCHGLEPREKEVQAAVRRWYEGVGCEVVNLSQVRRSMVTIGIGDMFVMRRDFPSWWHETKRAGGTQSLAQESFEGRCRANGVGYVLGGEYEALVHLELIGLWRLPAGRSWDEFAVPTPVRKQSEIDARVRDRKRVVSDVTTRHPRRRRTDG